MKFRLTNNITGESITIDQPTDTAAQFAAQLISNGRDEEYSIVKIAENDDIYSKLRSVSGLAKWLNPNLNRITKLNN